MPIYLSQDNSIQFKNGLYIPGIYNIYYEILVNARDQGVRIKQRSSKKDIQQTEIKIEIDEKTGRISIYNNGTGVDIAKHPTVVDEEGNQLWIPSMIFGELLTSGNYLSLIHI